MTYDHYTDRGRPHRARVLSCLLRLWEKHPKLSFCDLVDRYIIDIGTMAGHVTDSEVIERSSTEAEKP